MAHNDEYCILDGKFKDLVSELHGFQWVDEWKPGQEVATAPPPLTFEAALCNLYKTWKGMLSMEVLGRYNCVGGGYIGSVSNITMRCWGAEGPWASH